MIAKYNRMTDTQAQISLNLLGKNRPSKHSLRDIVDSILYVVRTGVQWRNLPAEFPPYQAVYYYFLKWSKSGVIEQMNTFLVSLDRKLDGREAFPSMACIDCQMVKGGPFVSEDKGINGGKKINGRGRTFLVDTEGRIIWAYVAAANVHDGASGVALLESCKEGMIRLEKIVFDVAYNGVFAKYVREVLGMKAEMSSRPPTTKGFVPLRKRWVSERTFGWLNFFRRLDKDHEKTAKSSESMNLFAHIQIMLQRIDKKTTILMNIFNESAFSF
jgi:putative transposase